MPAIDYTLSISLVCAEGGSAHIDQSRPASLSLAFWWRVLTASQRPQCWAEHSEQPVEVGELGHVSAV